MSSVLKDFEIRSPRRETDRPIHAAHIGPQKEETRNEKRDWVAAQFSPSPARAPARPSGASCSRVLDVVTHASLILGTWNLDGLPRCLPPYRPALHPDTFIPPSHQNTPSGFARSPELRASPVLSPYDLRAPRFTHQTSSTHARPRSLFH